MFQCNDALSLYHYFKKNNLTPLNRLLATGIGLFALKIPMATNWSSGVQPALKKKPYTQIISGSNCLPANPLFNFIEPQVHDPTVVYFKAQYF